MPVSVGHPRKYQTQEEQRQAHAESSARSYTRHKRKINKRHQRKYQVADPPLQVSAVSTHQNISQPKTIIKSLNLHLLNRALRKNDNFLALVEHSPHAYAERLSSTSWKRELIKDVTIFEDRILNAAGVGNDLAEVQKIWEGMQEVERWLEDILCGTLEGVDILTKVYQDQTLMYQLAK
ncbi:hypothetical protein IW261DRAFT_1574850 [Armillaria novae-zelandiae]|uniref:Uncharacterized protein n=1 Tax=Armillaria novae-zelandiae TaxID=153914 RepID=A0AA39NHK1_9AGAR|nr:hypothetical protein IW261DRAFT_1574850 [Armillaria novae-zelandiae]